jgi:hypothetical protein
MAGGELDLGSKFVRVQWWDLCQPCLARILLAATNDALELCYCKRVFSLASCLHRARLVPMNRNLIVRLL